MQVFLQTRFRVNDRRRIRKISEAVRKSTRDGLISRIEPAVKQD